MTSKGAPNSTRGGSRRSFRNSKGGGVVGEVLGIRGGVVGEVLGIRGGGSRRSFRNSRRGVVGEVLGVRGGGG